GQCKRSNCGATSPREARGETEPDHASDSVKALARINVDEVPQNRPECGTRRIPHLAGASILLPGPRRLPMVVIRPPMPPKADGVPVACPMSRPLAVSKLH